MVKEETTETERTFEEIRDEVLALLEAKKYIRAREEVLKLNEADIAEIIEETRDELGLEISIILFRMLPKNEAAEIFSRLSSDDQVAIINGITDKEINFIIGEMDFDDMIDVLEELPANVVDKILEKATKQERRQINTFLNYPEESAGSLMTPDYITLKLEWTVAEALKHIKEVGKDSETVYTCYVKDRGRKLIGIVSLKSLVVADPDTPIADIMVEESVYVNVNDDQEVVSNAFKKYGFLAIPVVDNEKRLVGIITFDDILQVVEEEFTEDFERVGGVMGSDDKEYLDTGVFRQVRNRFPWLVLLMCSAMLTGVVISRFENLLSSVASLAIYLPLLMGTGGNSGSQASTLVIRGLALGELAPKDALRVLWKELRISLTLAVCLSFINVLKIIFLDNYVKLGYINSETFQVAVTVALAQIMVIILAKCLGGMLPLLAKKVGIDPALMAAPFISSLTDTFTCLIYFTLASFIFH